MTRFMPLLLPPVDRSQTTRALRGLFIPGWVEPVTDADYGISRIIVFTHLPDESPKDALCIIDPWHDQREGDHVDIYLDDLKIAEADIRHGEEDKRLLLSLPHDRITPDWGENFHFKLTRAGATQPGPGDESVRFRLRIKLDRPGNKDRDPHLPGHSELKAPLPPANIIRDGVDAESAKQGFNVEIKPYPYRAPQDVVQLAWGSAFVYRTITAEEAAGTDSIFIRVEQDTILAGGDSANLLVHYMVFDEVWNYAEKYSLQTRVKVEAGASRLPAPLIKESSDGVIDLIALGKQNVTVQIVVQGSDFALNDTLEMIWTGTPLIGAPLINTQTTTIDNLPHVYEFEIPNREIRAIAGGSGDVYYVLRKADNSPPLSSRHTFASVVGEVSSLPAPSILELVGDTLAPDLASASVVIHGDPGIKAGDQIKLVWLGEKANNGGPYLHEHPHTVSENEEGADITIRVPGEHIAVLNGGTLDLFYWVSNDNATVYDVRESEHLEVKVKHIVAELPAPKVVEAPDNILDPDQVTGNATLLVDYLGTAPGDILTYYWQGTPGDGSSSDWVPITTVTAGKPITFTLLRALIIANRDRIVQVRYTLKRAATGQYSYSQDLELLIGQEVVPTITSVKGRLSNAEIEEGGTTVETRVILSGDANKGLKVQVYDGVLPVGMPVTADSNGNWSLEVSNLSIDLHSMKATALYGSGASSNVRTFHVATEVKPVITRAQTPGGDVGNGDTTVATSVILHGKATANTKVEILDGTTSKGTADVNANGDWTSTSIALAVGDHSFTAKTVGGSQTSTPWVIKVATEVKPVINRAQTPGGDVGNGDTTVATSVILHGKATANTKVEILDGTTSKGTADVNANGDWTSTSIAMAAGTHSFTAKTVGGSQTSTPWVVKVATEVKPVINRAQTPVGDVGNGDTTVATSVILHGKGTANTKVQILDGTTSKGTADVNANGDWTSTSIAMAAGTHSFTAKTVGGSQTSTPWVVKVATEVKPVINRAQTPVGDVGNGDSTVATSVILHGKGTANTKVQILDGTTSKGTADVNANGDWTSTSIAMAAGTHSFTAKTVGGSQTSTPWVVKVATEVKPVINRAQTPVGDVGNGDSTVATSVILHGKATANTKVEILDGTTSKGTADVNANGDWTSTSIAMAAGTHSFTAKTVGGSQTSTPWVVKVATEVKPVINRAQTPVGDVGNGDSTVATSVILHGKATANTKVEILDGTTSKGTADVNANGDWTSTSIAMAVGTHSFTAKTVGGSQTSTPWVVKVATEVKPVINRAQTPVGDVGNGGSTVATSVFLHGKGTANTKVEILDGTTSKGTADVNANGDWVSTSIAMAAGTHSFTAKTVNGSQTSAPWVVHVYAQFSVGPTSVAINGNGTYHVFLHPDYELIGQLQANHIHHIPVTGGVPPYYFQVVASNPVRVANVNQYGQIYPGRNAGTAIVRVSDSGGNWADIHVSVTWVTQWEQAAWSVTKTQADQYVRQKGLTMPSRADLQRFYDAFKPFGANVCDVVHIVNYGPSHPTCWFWEEAIHSVNNWWYRNLGDGTEAGINLAYAINSIGWRRSG